VNFKTTVVMLVLLAGIAGAYLWLRSAGPSGAPPAATLPSAIVTGRAFSWITIEQAGQRLVLEEQDRGGWWQTAPVRFPVTGEAIETLINAGLALTPREVFSFTGDDPLATDPERALASFGLKPPRATVTFRSDTGEHRLRLGDKNVAGSAYLQVAGEDNIYLVDAALHEAILGVEAQAWRPPQLPMLDPGRVTRIVIDGSQSPIELTRTAEGWSLRPDGGERADDALALQLATLTQQISPLRYVSDDPEALSQYGLDQPRVTLTTADATGTQHTLRLGQPGDLNAATVYVTWSDTAEPSPVVFVLRAASFSGLEQLTADQLRDPRVVIARPGAIRGQQVNRVGRDTVEITRRSDGSGPAFVEPQTGYAPDPEQAERWLATLTRAEPVGFTRAPREAQAPIALAELKLTGGRAERVRIYADRDARDDVFLAVREDEAVAALVPREQIAPLLDPVVTLRNRRLPDAGEVPEIRLTRDDGEMFRFTQNNGRWTPQNDDFTDDWEAESFDQLAQWAQTPRVKSWTPRPELPRGPIARLSLGDDRPAYAVNIEQNLGQRTDLPGVFRLPPEITALFAAEYRNRLLLPYRADQISRVELGIVPFDAAAVELPPVAVVMRADQGTYETAAGQRYDNQAECAALYNLLAGLSAKRIVPALLPEQRQTPIKFWQLDTDDGQTHRLLRYNQGVWSLNDETYFFVDVETDRRLTQKDTEWGQALVLPDAP